MFFFLKVVNNQEHITITSYGHTQYDLYVSTYINVGALDVITLLFISNPATRAGVAKS